MSHSNQPEYFTLLSVCPYDGSTTVVGIFEDMDAVSYRLKRMYTSCGDEYRIECFHLTTQDAEEDRLAELLQSRKDAAAKRDHLEEKADNNT